jgi:hypothetical protein
MALYALDETIQRAISDKDGILGQAIAWLLQEKNIKYKAGSFARDHELDFLFERGRERILIECKMHKIKRDPDSTENNLKRDISQMRRALESLPQDARASKAILVTNYDRRTIKTALTNFGTEQRNLLKKHNIAITDPQGLKRWLDKAA